VSDEKVVKPDGSEVIENHAPYQPLTVTAEAEAVEYILNPISQLDTARGAEEPLVLEIEETTDDDFLTLAPLKESHNEKHRAEQSRGSSSPP